MVKHMQSTSTGLQDTVWYIIKCCKSTFTVHREGVSLMVSAGDQLVFTGGQNY